MITRNSNEQVLAWASHQLGMPFGENCRAFGIYNRNGELIGAAVWSSYEFANIELSCVGAGAFRKDVCRELAGFAFDELGCERISLTVPASDERTATIAGKFGWILEGVKRRYYGDDDALIFGLLKEDCPFYASR